MHWIGRASAVLQNRITTLGELQSSLFSIPHQHQKPVSGDEKEVPERTGRNQHLLNRLRCACHSATISADMRELKSCG